MQSGMLSLAVPGNMHYTQRRRRDGMRHLWGVWPTEGIIKRRILGDRVKG